MNRKTRVLAAVLAPAAALATAGGVAYAEATGGPTFLTACVNNQTGVVRIIDLDTGGTCLTKPAPLAEHQIKLGLNGPPGAPGAPGAAGSPGPVGATGKAGATGPAGSAGAAGATGSQGAAGPDGPAGPTGNLGADGPAGRPGASGKSGPAGAQGTAGGQGLPNISAMTPAYQVVVGAAGPQPAPRYRIGPIPAGTYDVAIIASADPNTTPGATCRMTLPDGTPLTDQFPVGQPYATPVTAPLILTDATQLLVTCTETTVLGVQADFVVREFTSLNAEG